MREVHLTLKTNFRLETSVTNNSSLLLTGQTTSQCRMYVVLCAKRLHAIEYLAILVELNYGFSTIDFVENFLQFYEVTSDKRSIDQFRCIKIQLKTTDLSTRLRGITTQFVGFIPQSLLLRSVVLG